MLGAKRSGVRFTVLVVELGQVDYPPTFEAMKAYTVERSAFRLLKMAHCEVKNEPQPNTYGRDQLWICEHLAVYTQGLAGKVEHVLNPGSISVVQTDRRRKVIRKTIEMCRAQALRNEP